MGSALIPVHLCLPSEPGATMTSSIRGLLRTVCRASVGAGVALALCAAVSAHAEDLRIGGTGAALGTMQRLAAAYASSHPELKITVLPNMGSSGAIKAVLAGAIELGVSSRPLSAIEIQAGASQLEYARTPFVFAVAGIHSTVDIDTQDLVDIYAGRKERWSDGSRIRLVLRPIGDTDNDLIEALSPALREANHGAQQRKGMSIATTDQQAAQDIERVPGALGPSTLAQIISEQRPLRALRLNGVAPSAASIADGRYPLYKRLMLVTGPKATSAGRGFVAFVRSAAGRAILAQTGHWVR